MNTPDDIIGEEWRPVKNWESYEVSNLGRVRSLHRKGRIRKPAIRSGYEAVDLWMNGDNATFLVHLLVLRTFVGPAPTGLECNHKDGNKRNNRIDNLEWVTRSYNQLHAIRLGLATPWKNSHYKKGMTQPHTVLDRTCIKCRRPQTVKARRMCSMCWQRWRYDRPGVSKKDIVKQLRDAEAKRKIAEAALEDIKSNAPNCNCYEMQVDSHCICGACKAKRALSRIRSTPPL